jgi:hypothetical protein
MAKDDSQALAPGRCHCAPREVWPSSRHYTSHTRMVITDYRRDRHLFSKEDDNVLLSYIYLLVDSTKDGTKSTVHVCMLRNGDDAWHTHLTLTVLSSIDPLSIYA